MSKLFPSLLMSIIAAVVIFAVSIVVYQRIRHQEENVNFFSPAKEFVEVTQERIFFTEFPLKSLQRFYDSSDLINAQEFDQFTSVILESFPSVETVAWLPKVNSVSQLMEISQEVGARIKTHALMHAQDLFHDQQENDNSPHYPLALMNNKSIYVEQIKEVIWNEALIQSTLQRSLSTGKPSATVPFFVGDQKTNAMVLVALPMYKKASANETVMQRSENNSGFLVIILDIKALIGDYFRGGVAEDITLYSQHADEPQLIYRSQVLGRNVLDNTTTYTAEFNIADRAWKVVISRVDDKRARLYLIIPALALFIGLSLIYLQVKQINSLTMCNEKNIALENLKFAQDKLVETEKITAMGGVVAGISHEVNTPLGISITAISHLIETLDDLHQSFMKGTLDKTKFEEFIEVSEDLTKMALNNLNRAAKLVVSFKRISVDESKDGLDDINVSELLKELFANFEVQYKEINFDFEINCDPSLVIHSYPGAFVRVISYLVANSIRHGFKQRDDNNLIQISVRFDEKTNHQVLRYSDNGCGIEEELLSKIFEPFYTTSRGAGNAGLGLSVVYNLITQKMLAELSYGSEVEQGFWIEFSLVDHKSDSYEI